MSELTVSKILEKLPALIQAVEEAIPERGKGPDKVQAILQMLLVMVPADDVQNFMDKTWPRVKRTIAVLVELYNFLGFFKGKPA